MAQANTDLQDADFWENSQKGRDEHIRRLRREQGLGFLLDGPLRVDLAERKTLPVVVVRACNAEQNYDYSLSHNGLLTAVRLESHDVFVGRAMWTKRGKKPRPASFPADGVLSEQSPLEVREQVDLPWKPGTYVIRLAIFDQLSNAVRSELRRGAVADPEVQAFLESYHKPAFPRPIDPPLPPRGEDPEPPPSPYRPDAETPALADGELGLQLNHPRVALLDQDKPVFVRGSFRLPVLARQVVRERPEDEEEARGWQDVGDPEARAVLPITLLLTGQQMPDPLEIRLQVPCYELEETERGAVGRGCFRLDLSRQPGIKLIAQTYAVYGFYGEVCAGPSKLGLVSQDMLPEPGE